MLTRGAEGPLDVLGCPDVEEALEIARVGAGSRVLADGGEDAAVTVEELRDVVLDDALGRVRDLEHVWVAHDVCRLAEGPERERGGDVRALKQLGVVAHLAELHDEVHKALDAVVVVERRGARHEVGDADVLAKGAVHALLAWGEVAVEVDLDLREQGSVDRSRGKNCARCAPCRRARSGHSS